MLDHGWQVFQSAIEILKRDGEDPRSRLVSAMHEIASLQLRDTTPEFRDEIDSIRNELSTREAAASEGTIAATVNRLTEVEVQGYIERIIDLGGFMDACQPEGRLPE